MAKFGGNLSNPSVTTGKCRNVTLRVKLGFPFLGTSMYPIGTKFSAAPLLEDYAKVAKFGGNLSNHSMTTGKCRNVTLRVKLRFPFLGTSMYLIGTIFCAALLPEDYAKVAKFGGNLSNPSVTTGKCRNVTLRVKLGFPFLGTSMYPIGTKFSAAPLLEDYAKVAKFGGNLSNHSMTTGKCRNVTLRVKLRFPFSGTSMYPIGTIFSAAPLLEDYAKVAKFGGNLSNPSMPTGKWQNVTLRVSFFGLLNVSDRHQIWCGSTT